MRVSDLSWSIQLSARERLRHTRAFPLSLDEPGIRIVRLPGPRFVIEAHGTATPLRLSRTGSWEAYDVNAPARSGHQFSTWPAVMGALARGEQEDGRQGVIAA